MTRVLYIVDEAYPTTSANGRIVYRIIDELIKHPDISITILTHAQTKEQLQQTNYHGCPIIHTPNIHATAAEQLNKRLGKRKWLRYLMMPRTIYYRLRGESNYFIAEAKHWIRRHLREFDVIVANSMPYEPIIIASTFGKKIPVVYYKMEPIAHYYNRNDFEEGRAQEEKWDNNARAIIMTEVIFRAYREYASKENINKVVLTQFPCVIERKVVNKFQRMLLTHTCNLVYVGKFYQDKRNPQYLFSLMDYLSTKGIHLTIAGGIQHARLPQDMIDRYFTNQIPYITYLGELSAEQADQLLQEADVLVHQGNTVPDMMPSKILDYISSGKPILNIYGIDECPTLPLMEKYDKCINLKEGEPISQDMIDDIVHFCMENKGNQIPFEQIKKEYKDCTPEYVGQQFYEVIQSVTNK